jgi:hypothetical protein
MSTLFEAKVGSVRQATAVNHPTNDPFFTAFLPEGGRRNNNNKKNENEIKGREMTGHSSPRLITGFKNLLPPGESQTSRADSNPVSKADVLGLS